MSPNLVFLKLGGSLITDKSKRQTPRLEVIQQIAQEISQALQIIPDLKLIIGHGSGSYGHNTAKKYHTREGVYSREDWKGFAHVWYDARTLNQIMVDAFFSANLPVIAFPPSAIGYRKDNIVYFETNPIHLALEHRLIPVVQGDVLFDLNQGGTIVSTEEVFFELAAEFLPSKILLAGIEDGVWADYPTCHTLVEEIHENSFISNEIRLSGSSAIDVTGGMLEKVKLMLSLTQNLPGTEAWIFNGGIQGNIIKALTGNPPGTKITSVRN